MWIKKRTPMGSGKFRSGWSTGFPALVAAGLLLALGTVSARADDDCDVDLGDPDFSETARGLPPDSEPGASLSSAGDLNLDRLGDWIVGAPAFETAETPPGAGAVAVYLGAADRAARTAPDLLFLGAGPHDRAGSSVAGDFDFDGDGFPDLLIGAEQVNRTGVDDLQAGCRAGEACGAGKVYLIYFRPSEYDLSGAEPDLVDLSTVGQPGGVSGVVFNGVAVGDRVGFSVDGGGRMNHDARDDIAIGAPGRATFAGAGAGTVYAVFGDPSLSGTVRLDRVASDLAGAVDGVVYEGAMAGGRLGHAVTFPGDVVGSSGHDLVMGAPGSDHLAPDAGSVFAAAAGKTTRDTIEACDLGGAKAGFQLHGTQAGEQLGFSLAAGGDNLANGQLDLLIGAPGFDSATAVDTGRVVQTASKVPVGAFTADQVGASPLEPGAQEGIRYIGAAPGDRLGTAVAGVGDLTGEGADQAAFGAPFADRGRVADAGKVYLRSAFAPAHFHLGTVSVATGFPGVTFTGSRAGELSGAALAGAGDLGADGLADFLVGSPGGALESAAANPGRTLIVFDQPDDCEGDDSSEDDDD